MTVPLIIKNKTKQTNKQKQKQKKINKKNNNKVILILCAHVAYNEPGQQQHKLFAFLIIKENDNNKCALYYV